MKLALAGILLLCLSGCVSAPAPDGSTLVLNENLRWSAWAWQREARTRLPNSIVVCVHGGTASNGQWVACPDDSPPIPVEALAKLLKRLYPTRELVFTTCNADHLPVPHVRGAWFARELVFNPPMGKPGLQTRWGMKGVGRIQDFVQGD